MLNVTKGFLWGDAVAAHQLEGGWKEGGKVIDCFLRFATACFERYKKRSNIG